MAGEIAAVDHTIIFPPYRFRAAVAHARTALDCEWDVRAVSRELAGVLVGLAGAPDDTRRLAVIAVCVATAIASSLLSEFGGPAIRPRELALVADVVGLSLLVRLSGR